VSTSIYDAKYRALRIALIGVRKAAGLTQIQMAEKLSVGQSYISKIERGESYIDILVWVNWCKACNTSPGQLLDTVMDR
jgi:transcriptional regulator with XRE-family HTH domain